MLKITELLEKDPAKTVALVAGAGLLIVTLPFALKAAKPLTRKALKSILLVAEKGKVLAAESVEDLEDLVAEVKSEMAESKLKTSDPSEEDIETLTDTGS